MVVGGWILGQVAKTVEVDRSDIHGYTGCE